ncbi:MAG: hypothetical protein WCS89_03630 [Candidatus Paceibacterota bacterium]|jgi:hypothetical protein
MKNYRKTLIVLLLIVIVALIIGCAIYYYNPNKVVTTISVNTDITNSEMPPRGKAPYLNVQNINEQTGLAVIDSPKFGDSFILGNPITIKWNPELIDVSTIQLVSGDDSKIGGMQIYKRASLDDKNITNARFDYVIPNNLTVYPGQYRIKLLSYAGRYSYTSDVFTIKSSAPLRQRADKPFVIKSIMGAMDSYRVGESMNLNIETENGDGTPADNSKGFNVQARLYNNDGQGVWSGNATYNPNAQVWHLNVPLVKDTYRLQVTLYCSLISINSVCAQEYDINKEVSQYLNFIVNP